MDARTIDILAALSADAPPLGALPKNRLWSPLHAEAKDRFLSKYIQTNFGHYIALQFANRRAPFPIVLTGRDLWVYKAYLMNMNPWVYFDQHVAEAYHLSNCAKDQPALIQALKAMLLTMKPHTTAQQHIAEISVRTGVHVDTLDAFEILFYNVIDRQEDALYMAREVYPDTRLVELDENYMRNSTHADLIKRVAYNHRDMDLTAYLAGLGDHTYLRKLSASEDREADLTRYLMGNGLIMAHSSLLNQRSVGVSRVATLLAASRQGGKEQEEPTIGGIVPMYTQAFKAALNVNRTVLMEQLRVDAAAQVTSAETQ